MSAKNIILWSPEFRAWFSGLKDGVASMRILSRLDSASFGNFGDCESVGEGISEMRIHVGKGYRVYYTRTGATVYVLLTGGHKGSQKRDIERAKALAGKAKEMK